MRRWYDFCELRENIMSNIYENLEKKYIVKKSVEPRKMKRNLQPEIEKIKSVNQSVIGVGYISISEKERLKSEITKLLNNLDCI